MPEPNPVQQILQGTGTRPGQTEGKGHAVLKLVTRLVQPLLALDKLGLAFGNTPDGGAAGHARVPRSLCRRAGESRWSVRMAPPQDCLARCRPTERRCSAATVSQLEEVVPSLVEVEVAVPRLTPALR